MVQRDIQRAADPADPVLDEATVLRLVRQHLSSASAVTDVDETGGEARAYVIDEQYIFKTQRPHRLRPRTSLQKEVFFLDILTKEAPELPVPRVLGYGKEGFIEYILMTRIPGQAFRTLRVNSEARQSILRSLGRTLRRTHSLPQAVLQSSELLPGDRDGHALRARIVGGLRESAKAIAAQKGMWTLEVTPERVAEDLIAALALDEPRVALHSNPGPEHVFLDPEDLRYTGLIDFGDAYISHPAFDMRRWTARADRTALLEGYSSDGALTDAFMATLQAVQVGGLMATIAGLSPGAVQPERRARAMEDLRDFLRG